MHSERREKSNLNSLVTAHVGKGEIPLLELQEPATFDGGGKVSRAVCAGIKDNHTSGRCLLFRNTTFRRLNSVSVSRGQKLVISIDRYHLKTDTESNLRNVVFLNKRQDGGQRPKL
jgi:hypothetical protein